MISRYWFVNIAIGLSVVVVLCVTAWVHYQESNWTATGTVCMAGFAAIGIIYSNITISMMKEENRPYVFVDFVVDNDVPTFIDLELSNYGRSAAQNLSIEVIAPDNEDELLSGMVILQKVSDMSIICNEIHYLPPGRSFFVKYAVGYMINPHLPVYYSFKITYRDVYGKAYCDTIKIEPTHLMSCSAADKEINKHLRGIKENMQKINVSIQN